MAKIFYLLVMVLCAAGCASTGKVAEVDPDVWRHDWEILVNFMETNLKQPGHHKNGWNDGELDPGKFVNRPNYEGAGKRVGILALAPLSTQEPAKIRFTGIIPLNKPVLSVQAGGNIHGDCLLQIVVNGNKVSDWVLNGSQWTTCEADLSGFVGKDIDLQIWNAPGGKNAWYFEHCYIDKIEFRTAVK